jgi:hypothetical protein
MPLPVQISAMLPAMVSATFAAKTPAPDIDTEALIGEILETIDRLAIWPDPQMWLRQWRYRRLRWLKDRLAVEFGRRRGWQMTRSGFQPSVLARRGTRNGYRDFADRWQFTDHTYRYKIGRHAAGIATHPYDVDDRFRDGARRWAEQCGIRVEFPTDFPSWWYPGRTTLVVFTPLAPDPMEAPRVDALNREY